ncbi:FMN-binding negative transcriptional regulator [Streptomyces huiliensis]|uniref:FMN-binding negative transcriptional regulator n=1 Tax=Streptomyces huiliensis TaxID=2876027 RepID=UPI001CBD6BDD|nr:FMN-binding negative transcriptional regulator [Streptomyces huiliensis]MBZ4321256.1 FMN-binding negative transcriptional regulator [Streptomyces huiliensis]
MYVPDHYRPKDPAWLLDVIRGNPLATLVSNGPDGPLATHLPVIPDEPTLARGTGDTGLVGTRFHGHLNRSNPHWSALDSALPALLVFRGPGAYVSPTVYDVTPAAPTWNFVAVHLRGTITPLPGSDETLDVIRATVRAYERDHGTGWDMTESVPYFERMLPGVGAFRFDVTAADAMFKLSQEKPDETRDRVAEAFACSGSGPGRDVAAAMRHYS